MYEKGQAALRRQAFKVKAGGVDATDVHMREGCTTQRREACPLSRLVVGDDGARGGQEGGALDAGIRGL